MSCCSCSQGNTFWAPLSFWMQEGTCTLKFWMEVDLPASFRVWFTQLTIMSSLAFWPSPRSSRTFSVYLRTSRENNIRHRAWAKPKWACSQDAMWADGSLESLHIVSALPFFFFFNNSFNKKEESSTLPDVWFLLKHLVFLAFQVL